MNICVHVYKKYTLRGSVLVMSPTTLGGLLKPEKWISGIMQTAFFGYCVMFV